MSRVLIVEDEAHLAKGLRFNLELEGYAVDVLADGNEALACLLAAQGIYDAVILDVMLPGRDGFDVAAELRKAGQYVPILMLTARGRAEDVLRGFAAGADDYLPKPFELAILLARVRGLLRRRDWLQQSAASRTPSASPPADASAAASSDAASNAARGAPAGETGALHFAGKTLDLKAFELRVGEKRYQLTVMESDLLQYLVQNAGHAVSRKAILEHVWGLREDTDTRAIDNFIVRLRRYLEEDPAAPRHLLTVRGVGYKFVAEPAAI
jgi:DNA-binding response OmpR family regulator